MSKYIQWWNWGTINSSSVRRFPAHHLKEVFLCSQWIMAYLNKCRWTEGSTIWILYCSTDLGSLCVGTKVLLWLSHPKHFLPSLPPFFTFHVSHSPGILIKTSVNIFHSYLFNLLCIHYVFILLFSQNCLPNLMGIKKQADKQPWNSVKMFSRDGILTWHLIVAQWRDPWPLFYERQAIAWLEKSLLKTHRKTKQTLAWILKKISTDGRILVGRV